jgi:DNA repair protein RecO (recombination protein O)
MEWTDSGVIVGMRPHGESAAILTVFTTEHGLSAGMVRNGQSPRTRAMLQVGNGVFCRWSARLEHHLGYYTLEVTEPRAGHFLASRRALLALQAVLALVRLLPERIPHPTLYNFFVLVLDRIADSHAPLSLTAALLARFELALLAELGFGLDLTCCTLTGLTEDLAYVSPRSGRAVSRIAGLPWKEKLLACPDFLKIPLSQAFDPLPTVFDVQAAFALTGFFLTRHVFMPRHNALPIERHTFLTGLSEE